MGWCVVCSIFAVLFLVQKLLINRTDQFYGNKLEVVGPEEDLLSMALVSDYFFGEQSLEHLKIFWTNDLFFFFIDRKYISIEAVMQEIEEGVGLFVRGKKINIPLVLRAEVLTKKVLLVAS